MTDTMIKVPEEAIRPIIVAGLADQVRILDELKADGRDDIDDKKHRKALIKTLRYFTTKDEFEKLGLKSCNCKD